MRYLLQTGEPKIPNRDLPKIDQPVATTGWSRRKLASLALVLGVLGGSFYLRGNRRVELSFVLQVLRPQCLTNITIRLGESYRLSRKPRNDLPSWKVYIRPGEYRIEGAVECLSGRRFAIDGWDISVDQDQTIPVNIASPCSC